MHSTTILSSLFLASSAVAQTTFQTSSKRGLVFVENKKAPNDNKIWAPPGTDLTWYYNYEPMPESIYADVPQSEFEFVPQCWGKCAGFTNQMKVLMNTGRNISHILGFNEPDEPVGPTGGSGIDPYTAAQLWIDEIEPLREMGIKVGGPGITGSQRGINWLASFFNACADLGTNCTVDFQPMHWYGNFEGLASFMGQLSAT
jgi:hypothetical protein